MTGTVPRGPLSPGTAILGGALAAASVLAAVLTLAAPDLLSGPTAMNGSARGTALVVLVGGVPSLVIGLAGAIRGSMRHLTVTAGAAAYLAYNGFLFLFATPFNRAFLAYEVMFGLAFWLLVVVCVQLWARATALEVRPARAVAVFIGVVVAVNALGWLFRVTNAALSAHPDSLLAGTGLTTSPVYVQDLAIWLPALSWLASGVWQGHAPRLALTAGALWYWVLEGVGVAVDQWWGHHADPSSQVVSVAVVPVFAVIAVATLWPWARIQRELPVAYGELPAERSHAAAIEPGTASVRVPRQAVTNGGSGRVPRP